MLELDEFHLLCNSSVDMAVFIVDVAWNITFYGEPIWAGPGRWREASQPIGDSSNIAHTFARSTTPMILGFYFVVLTCYAHE